jgi:DNA primase
MEYVEQHLKDLKKQIAQSSSDSETLFQLMADFKDMTEMRNALARQLGNNIIV